MKLSSVVALLLTLLVSFLVGSHELVQSQIKGVLMPPIEFKSSALAGRLQDYFLKDEYLNKAVDDWYNQLSDTARIGQLIMPAWDSATSVETLSDLIKNETVGGFMVLRSDFSRDDIEALKKANSNSVPLLVSVDAEPSLLKYRFNNPVFRGETVDLKTTKEITNTGAIITDELKNLGLNLNFAPVYDVNKNRTVIAGRSFSDNPTEVAEKAQKLADVFMKNGVIATAKHFPGHGLVSGDTHKSLQTIVGEFKELEPFKAAIKHETPVMMVGHLAVQNSAYDTDGLPATLSPVIMQQLLRSELGFKGVAITDAMNMQAVANIEDADIKALQAGVDIVLMPKDPAALNTQVQQLADKDALFKAEIETKIKRVLRLKLVWALQKYY